MQAEGAEVERKVAMKQFNQIIDENAYQHDRMTGERQRHDKFDPRGKIQWCDDKGAGFLTDYSLNDRFSSKLEAKERSDHDEGTGKAKVSFDWVQ